MNKQRDIKKSVVFLSTVAIWYGLSRWLGSMHRPVADLLSLALYGGGLVFGIRMVMATYKCYPEQRPTIRGIAMFAIATFLGLIVWALVPLLGSCCK